MSNLQGSINTKINLSGELFKMGTKGYSAYEVAVQQGFKGTVDEWLASLVGPPGQDGSIKFEELTPEQKEMLRGPKGDPFLYSDFTAEQLEALIGPLGPQGIDGPQGPAGTPGADGKAATVKVGTVTTLEAGSNATVTNVGTETNAILNFGIPQGIPGEGGGSSEGGTTNYLLLENKPKINNVELTGNKTLADLGIQPKGNYLTSVPSTYKTKSENDELYQPKGNYLTSVPSVYKTKAENDALYQPIGEYASSSEIPKNLSDLTNDVNFISSIPSEYITENELLDLIQRGVLNKNYNKLPSDLGSINLYTLESGVYQVDGFKNIYYSSMSISSLEDNFQPDENTDLQDYIFPGDLLVHHKEINTQGVVTVNSFSINTRFMKNIVYDGTNETEELDIKFMYWNDLASKEYVANLISNINIPTKVSELDNDSSYATETYVTNAIANAELGGGDTEIDLSGYATKDDLATKVDKVTGKSLIADSEITRLASVTNYDDTEIKNTLRSKANTSDIPTKTSQLTNDSNYLTSIPSEYITETELNGKGFLTNVPSEYITETELNGKGYLTGIPTSYKTKTENDALYQPKGNYLTSIPSEYVTETEMNDAISNLGGGTGNVSSDIVNSIMVVDELPEVEEEGVLYLVKEIIETLINLYPSQVENTSTNGFTITFKDKNVIVTGSNTSSSVWGETEQFDMDLEANKTYYLQFTHESGTMDDSNRIANSDGIVTSIFLIGYDSSGKATNLINEVERDASGIYEKYTFTPTQEFVSYKLRLQTKKYISCNDWTLSIVIAEESE